VVGLAGGNGLALYLYGCAVCRRWTGRPLSSPARSVEDHHAARVRRLLRSSHALLDAAEMTVRLLAGVSRARVARRDLVITDRTPLDALVKHDPPPRSLAGRWYLALARGYRTLLWLDASPAVLAARDGEHPMSELAALRDGFARWAQMLPNVVRLDTGAATPADLRERALAISGRRLS